MSNILSTVLSDGEEHAEQGTLRSAYHAMTGDRSSYEERARLNSKLTVPTLMPPAGSNGSTKLQTPHQAVGSDGVNNLGAKMLLATFPANQPFFMLEVSEAEMRKVKGEWTQAGVPQEAQDKLKRSVQQNMSLTERIIMQKIKASPLRGLGNELMRHLLVSGNALLYVKSIKEMKLFKLDQYVVRRDGFGTVLEIVTLEKVAAVTLPKSVREACGLVEQTKQEDIEVYTGVYRRDRNYETWQEINGVEVPGSRGTYPLERCPWLALRFCAMSNEHYGRSFCDDHIGDIKSLEGMWKAINAYAAIASRIVFLVRPGQTSIRQFTQAANGQAIPGDVADVGAVQAQKAQDMSVVEHAADKLEKRLSRIFLNESSIQRPGDRVTAEEIRTLARQIEAALSGIYSVLAIELQRPIVTILLHQLQQSGDIPPFPPEIIDVSVTTGLEALGRGQDADRLSMYLQSLSQTATVPPQIAPYIVWEELLSRLAVSMGIDVEGLVKTGDQVMQEQQQAQMQDTMHNIAQSAAPGILQTGADAMMQGQPQ